MNNSILPHVKGAVGRLAGLSRTIGMRYRSKMLVVTFHRINDEIAADGLTHSSAEFIEYCEFFRRHFRVVTLAEQVAGGNATKSLGGTLSITLDDGYRDNFEVAAPILRKLNLPATFFVVSGFVGTQVIAPWDRHHTKQPGWMDWGQLRSLVSQGFEIGCHTESHMDLGIADPDTVRLELAGSKRKLSEQLGRPVDLFAYPFGGRRNISERSLQLVREAGFICCLSCHGGVNVPGTDPFTLNRIPMARGFRNPDQFGFDLALGRIRDV